jgi:protein-S-isoprenylcysteine O-methyltransferase Ste14
VNILSSRSRIVMSWMVFACFLTYILFWRPPGFFSESAQRVFNILGLVLLTAAAFGRVWCLLYVGGRKNKKLATFGPYSVVRNPLYVFSFLGTIGVGLTVKNPLLSLLLAMVFAVYYSQVVRKEEQKLCGLFGNSFRDYMACTPRWFPNVRLYKEAETISGEPEKVRQGMGSATVFIWVYVFWAALEHFRLVGLWPYGI